jgi:NhaA family Na+:H+ antiporter
MATDIAFALGALSLLGKRVPGSLTVFLTALAIADDIGAVLVIAIFYTGGVAWFALAVAAGLVVVSYGVGRAGVRQPWVFALLGVLLWWAMLASGVHATIAGVLLALTIPANTRIDESEFLVRSRAALDDLGGHSQHALHTLEMLCEQAQPPLHRLEYGLHGIVAFGVMPLFALANAGVVLGAKDVSAAVHHPVAIGIFLGLVIGKLVGITSFAFAAARLGIATVPPDLTRSRLLGGAALGGIGFTMALFVSELAFRNTPELLNLAKVGVLAASTVAGALGWVILRYGSSGGDANGTAMYAISEPGEKPRV